MCLGESAQKKNAFQIIACCGLRVFSPSFSSHYFKKTRIWGLKQSKSFEKCGKTKQSMAPPGKKGQDQAEISVARGRVCSVCSGCVGCNVFFVQTWFAMFATNQRLWV